MQWKESPSTDIPNSRRDFGWKSSLCIGTFIGKIIENVLPKLSSSLFLTMKSISSIKFRFLKKKM